MRSRCRQQASETIERSYEHDREGVRSFGALLGVEVVGDLAWFTHRMGSLVRICYI